MNEVYERNNIYFLFRKDNPIKIYLLLEENKILYQYPSLCSLGLKEDICEDKDFVFAPIDLLLFHIDSLEYLNREYSEKEINLLKQGKIKGNEYRKLKYTYNNYQIENLYQDLKQIEKEQLLKIINFYKSYFHNRKKDSVLRIYTLT